MRGDQLTLTAVQLIGLVDSKLIGAVHRIGIWLCRIIRSASLTNICSWCNAWNSFSWSYDSVCSDTVFNSSVGREVPQCELCGWCVGVVQYSSAVVGDLIHCDDTIRFWGSSPWDGELYHSWSGWQTRHWTRNCTGTHTNNATIMISSLLTILQCLHNESCTVWSSPSQHCCWIQCQSIHYHRTRRSCFKHCINYRYS